MGDIHSAAGAVHVECTRSHWEILAQRFGMSVHIKHSQGEKHSIEDEILPGKIEEGNMILQAGQQSGAIESSKLPGA